jgi:hypothetical protein
MSQKYSTCLDEHKYMFKPLHWFKRSFGVGGLRRHMKANVLLLKKMREHYFAFTCDIIGCLVCSSYLKQTYSCAQIAYFMCVILSSTSSLYLYGR